MKHFLAYLFALVLTISNTFGQDTNPSPADTSYWATGLKGVFTFTQTSYSNWQAGGENSVALNSIIRIFADYKKERISWGNRLDLAYGFTDIKSQGIRKTDDNLGFTTNIGYKIKEGDTKLYWTSSLSFLSQFTDGFDYPNDSVPISKIMAPGYLVVNTGLEYKGGDILSLIYSPVAGKWTFVQDDVLSAAGAYGVTPGEKIRSELGTTLIATFNKEIAKNIVFDSKLGLFSNYIENFGNVDVNWENIFLLKINDVISSNIVLHLIYDDDIKIPQFDDAGIQTGSGPRLQFKELFGLGITLTL